MDHKGGMMRNLAGEADINDGKSPRHYFRVPASSCPDLCKSGKKYDSGLAKRNGAAPTHLTSPETLDENFRPKKVGTAQARHKGEECGLETAFQTEDDVSYYSEVSNMAHLQHSNVSSGLIECISEESVNMKSRTSSPYLKLIRTSEQNSSFLEDGSLEESTLMVPEEVSSTFDENALSFDDDVPWAWSDGFSEGSAVMELESPPSALESMASTLISHDHKFEVSSMEFQVTPRKMMSLAAGELTNQVKESSDRFRSMKQETIRKSMAYVMAGSLKDTACMKPKEQKHVNGLKVDEKQKRELSMLRSSLPVKTSLLARVKDKKKFDAIVDPSITNKKSSTLDKTVKSVKPIQAGVIPEKGPRTSLSPIIINKKTSPPKRIQLSPKSSHSMKSKSSVIKYRSPMSNSGRITGKSSQESSKIARNAGMSKAGDKKILKKIAESEPPNSIINYAPGLNNRKLRSVKKQVEAGSVDLVKEKILHVVEQKLVGVAQKSAELKHMKLRSQLPLKTLPSRSSVSSSAFLSSSYEESDGSRLTISNVSGSRKAHIGEGKGRTPFHSVEHKLVGVALKFADQKHTKLSSPQSSRSLSSRSSISSSAFVSSGYEEEHDGSRLITSDVSGSKKTHIGDRKRRTPLHVVEQKLFGVAPISAEQKHLKLRNQLPSRTLSSRSSISSSAFVSSSCEEENNESQLTISDASGLKKTQICEGNGRTLYPKKSDYKKMPKQTENVTLEDKSLLNKMSFRRGKEAGSQREIPDQRIIRLIEEKTLFEAENFEGETGMSSFRESRESTTACSGTVSPGSPTVVLRNQDVQENNAQALSNDVIEETSNRLVETRKSKVMALVSSFESIISLQERTAL